MNKLEQAMEDHKQGKWELADKTYEEIIQEEPENAEAMYLLAISKNSQNQLDEALNTIDKAINIDQKAPAYLLTKGVILARKGEAEEAIEILSKALNENPNLYQGHITIGHLYYSMGKKTEALKHFNMAIKVDSKQIEGHVNLARLLIDDGEAQKAINILSEIEKEHPEQTSVKMMMGQGFVESGAYSFAENYFEKVLAMHPEYEVAGLYLGIAKINTGDIESAKKLILAYNKEHPNTKEGLAALGLLMYKIDKYDASINFLSNAMGKGIAPLSWRIALVESYAKVGQLDPAITLYENIGEKTTYIDTGFKLAELYERKGETKKAKSYYKKTKKENSKYAASLLGLTRCYLVEEKAEKAEKTIDKLIEKNKDHAEAKLLKITSLLFQGKKEQAIKILKGIDYVKYNEIYKKIFRLQHGLILDHMKKYKKALKVFLKKSKMEEENISKVILLKESEIQEIQQFSSQVEDDSKDPVFIVGLQSTAINEFAVWLNKQGITVLTDRLASKGRPDILYAERTTAVLTGADTEMVKLERKVYHQKAKAMLNKPNTDATTLADCMYINPKQIAIIRKFFPQSKVLLLNREQKDIEFNQTVFGKEPITAEDWQAVKEQVLSMGLDVLEIDIDSWLLNDEATLSAIGLIFDKELIVKQSDTTEYWRKSLFEKKHWKNYKELLSK